MNSGEGRVLRQGERGYGVAPEGVGAEALQGVRQTEGASDAASLPNVAAEGVGSDRLQIAVRGKRQTAVHVAEGARIAVVLRYLDDLQSRDAVYRRRSRDHGDVVRRALGVVPTLDPARPDGKEVAVGVLVAVHPVAVGRRRARQRRRAQGPGRGEFSGLEARREGG